MERKNRMLEDLLSEEPSILRMLHAEAQMAFMENWFRDRYEDPIHNCPGDEGEPVFIHGGPFDAREILIDEFGDNVSEEVIDSLADRLESECVDWSGIPSAEDYENDNFDVIDNPYEYLETALAFCRTTADESFSAVTQVKIYGLLYCNLITVVEVYLCESFKKRLNCIKENSAIIGKAFDYIKHKERTIEALMRSLTDRHWQDFMKSRTLYKAVLGVELPDHVFLEKALVTRHDVTHRNFKTKEGAEITIDRQQVLDLCNRIGSYARQIELPDEKPLLPDQQYVTRIGPGYVMTEIVPDITEGRQDVMKEAAPPTV